MLQIVTMTDRSQTRLTPPLKWHGGKSYLADWIIDLMPRHLHYVVPFGGGLAVLLAKNPFDQRHQWSEKSFEKGISEVVNDLNRALMNFWKVLQGPPKGSRKGAKVGPRREKQKPKDTQRRTRKHETICT